MKLSEVLSRNRGTFEAQHRQLVLKGDKGGLVMGVRAVRLEIKEGEDEVRGWASIAAPGEGLRSQTALFDGRIAGISDTAPPSMLRPQDRNFGVLLIAGQHPSAVPVIVPMDGWVPRRAAGAAATTEPARFRFSWQVRRGPVSFYDCRNLEECSFRWGMMIRANQAEANDIGAAAGVVNVRSRGTQQYLHGHLTYEGRVLNQHGQVLYCPCGCTDVSATATDQQQCPWAVGRKRGKGRRRLAATERRRLS